MTIKTYPEMDAKIIELLRWDTGNSLMLYAAQRIEELETATTHLEHLDAASQQALTRAMRENRVRAECLEIAMEALTGYADVSVGAPGYTALAEIRKHLAELEPEEEAG